jgi:Protein of unknown function (DUF3710)
MALRRGEKRTPQSKLDATPPWEVRHRPEPEPTAGPYDVRDAPADDVARIDLGGLRIPAASGMEMRLDLNDNQQVMSVTMVNKSGNMQLGVFAAPRNQGIWDEVRQEISESVIEQGGKANEVEGGTFGPELVGALSVEGRMTPVRFIGIDGPRWFLRGMLVGTAAADAAAARPFEAALRNVVVVRGTDPLPVREQVPLHLPKEALPDGTGDDLDEPTDGLAEDGS